MRIAIVGAGLTGSYLYRLLKGSGHTVELFDRPIPTRCGINPCAWGTSRGFEDLVAAAGLDPAGYVLIQSDHVMIDDVRIKGDLMTFDKRRLIDDLQRGAAVSHTELDAQRCDRMVDCTGVSRALLPPIEEDLVFRCLQYRIRTEDPLKNQIRLTANRYGAGMRFKTRTFFTRVPAISVPSLSSERLQSFRRRLRREESKLHISSASKGAGLGQANCIILLKQGLDNRFHQS